MSKKVINTPTNIQYHTYCGDMAGCGYIRVIFPSMLLSQYIHRDVVKFMPSYNLSFVNDAAFYENLLFVIFQRSSTPEQLNVIKYFKGKYRSKTKTPMIYEIDDLLTDIPSFNYCADYYTKHKDTATEIMKHSDGMVVSTEPLKKEFSKYNSNIVVCENHLVKGFWGTPEWKNNNNKKPRVLWAGSGNHFAQKNGVKGGDFDMELIDFIKKTTDRFQWVIMGGTPLELKDEDIEFHGWKDIFNYPSYLKSLKIDLGLAPLEHHIFNRCKSNIKSLEYTAAGIPGIYTHIDPYENLTKTAMDTKEMISHIESIVDDPIKRQDVWKKDYNILKTQLFWEDNSNLMRHFNKHLELFGLILPK